MKDSRTSRLLVLAGFLAVVLLIYLGVLYHTQVIHHEEYLARSLHSITEVEEIEASRGIITDRKGRPLVTNSSVYALTFDAGDLPKEADQNESILRLLELCQSKELAWVDNLPISSQAPFVYTLDEQSDIQTRRFLTYLKSLEPASEMLQTYLLDHPELAPPPEDAAESDESSDKTPGEILLDRLPAQNLTAKLLNAAGLTAATLQSLMRQDMELPAEFDRTQARQVLGVRYELALRKLANYTDYILVEEGVDTELISILNDGNYAGAKVISSSVRQYKTNYAAHILGYVDTIWAEDLETLAGKGYDGNDWIGRSGVEAAFEEYLKGTDGRRVVSVNNEGKVTGEYYSKEPKPGNTVELTLDLELQTAVEDALAKTVSKMNEEDGNLARGAGAAIIKVGSGEVLSLASYPTYDLATFRQNWGEIKDNPGDPMYNRATQGAYPPGSTFKPLVAVAALEEGVISLKEKINDTGRWYYPDIIEGTGSWYWNCWKGSGHGKIAVSEAITASCNYLFYELGYRLGIDALTNYATAFGLGAKTGIEIGDRAGILAGPESREAMGGVWYGGDVVQAAIGQSDNLFSPIQLANYIATLVSGGEHYETHLLKAVKSYDNSEVVAVGNEAPINTVSIKEENLNAVKKGMHDLTTSTLAPYFNKCIVDAGAKTGTAQLGANLTNNGVFVCFAPYENPEIALAIVIEKGGSGAALASAAVEMLNTYFSTEEVGTVILPENQLLQ